MENHTKLQNNNIALYREKKHDQQINRKNLFTNYNKLVVRFLKFNLLQWLNVLPVSLNG